MSRSSLSQFPALAPRQSIFSTRTALVSCRENVLILMFEANSGANPNSLFFGPFGVLDGCSLPRNQWRYQNLLIH